MKCNGAQKVCANGGNDLNNGRVVKYLECRKNHAADKGGYAVDGCREFMAAGALGTAAGLTCAACTCHRSFHRRGMDNEICNFDNNSTASNTK